MRRHRLNQAPGDDVINRLVLLIVAHRADARATIIQRSRAPLSRERIESRLIQFADGAGGVDHGSFPLAEMIHFSFFRMQFHATLDHHHAGGIRRRGIDAETGAKVHDTGLRRVEDESLTALADIDRGFSRENLNMHGIEETHLCRGE